ncbi:hypothetical protein ALO94_200383 [Pseudomonas syringae pv. spinaceae]|uniref:Uncharacterized protein n=1 Tax=Pseudomonas syringae pv. spinaceae TaxID=264459 RepID=A0A0P9ZRB6_PSESX|nr:hypothetical protein ALO94_200383 [Pseudomonas syringae pv. spinaceae]
MGLTRREALSSIAAVGGEKALKDALAVLGLGPSSHRRPQPLKLKNGLGQGTRVLVLGAGIAGLVTALELTRAGLPCRCWKPVIGWAVVTGPCATVIGWTTRTAAHRQWLSIRACISTQGPRVFPASIARCSTIAANWACRWKCWSTAVTALRYARTCNSRLSPSARPSTMRVVIFQGYWPRRCNAMPWTMC